MSIKVVYAEDLNYWKTSTVSADTWLDKAKKEITDVSGKILSELSGVDENGRAAYMLMFRLNEDEFKIVWPVLQSKKGELRAARIQAATMLYHDVKAKCVLAKVFGARHAFHAFLLLPNGRTAGEMTAGDFMRIVPDILALPSGGNS